MSPHLPSKSVRRFRAVIPAVLGVVLLASAGTAAFASAWSAPQLLTTGNGFGAPGNGNWPEFRFRPRGRRYNPREHIRNITSVGALKVLWPAQDGSFSFTAPVVVDGVAHRGTNAFGAETGELLWASNSGGFAAAVGKAKVYIDTQKGPCAYAAGGTNLWCAENSYLPDAPLGAAAVVGGIAYFGSAVGSVFDQRGHR